MLLDVQSKEHVDSHVACLCQDRASLADGCLLGEARGLSRGDQSGVQDNLHMQLRQQQQNLHAAITPATASASAKEADKVYWGLLPAAAISCTLIDRSVESAAQKDHSSKVEQQEQPT